MQSNVLQYFEATAQAVPDRPAVVERGVQVSFSALRSAALGLASEIVRKQDVRCQSVAVFLPKSTAAVTSFLAILYSANFYVPLDSKSPPERLAKILENLEPALVLTNAKLLPTLVKAGWSEDKCLVLDADTAPPRELSVGIAERFHSIIDTDPVYVIYTSGSTGVPKGVTIPHRGVIDYIDWANSVYDVSGQDVIGSQAPFFFDNSTLDLYLCFSRGAALDLVPEEIFAFPVKLMEHVRDAGITTIFWVPSLMTAVANFDILASVKPSGLNKILFAGEVMPARTLNYWRRHYPDALFSNLYGPTEITVDCTYYNVERAIADDEPVPIGFPCRNSDVLILTETDALAKDGETGELCVRGSSLALGYWNAPDKTAAAFVQNPLQPHYPERIYRTGDLVVRNPLGEILFVGRKDSQIKHQGYRIELGEIEMVAGALDGMRGVCVLYNQAKQEITLFYEAAQEIPARGIREAMAQRLPRYMLPAAFHWLAAMPMNANGKTDRVMLARQYFTHS